jgi:hypothetical protein
MPIFEASSRLIAQEELRYFTFSGWYYLPVKNGLLSNVRNFFVLVVRGLCNGAERSGRLFEFSTWRNLGFTVLDN